MKMLGKTILVFTILGTVCSEPIEISDRSITNPSDIISTLLSGNAEEFEIAIGPEPIRSMGNFVKSVIGFKFSALEIAVKVIHWIISNFIGIAIGGMIALGICKITGKCNLNYDHSISKLYSMVTPERLEMAQNLLLSAIRRLGQEDEEEEVEYEWNSK